MRGGSNRHLSRAESWPHRILRCTSRYHVGRCRKVKGKERRCGSCSPTQPAHNGPTVTMGLAGIEHFTSDHDNDNDFSLFHDLSHTSPTNSTIERGYYSTKEMESWQGLNYYTTSPEEWVHLMNLSTADFGVAPFPSNVIAIPDTLWNRTNHSIPIWFPNDTIIIENASKAQVGSRDIERIVFLSTSGLAIIWALWWLWINQGSLLRPRPRHPPAGTDIELANGAANLATNPNFLSASEFRKRLEQIIPGNVNSGIELVEKDLRYDEIQAEDVEEMVDLVQKMYEADLAIWSLQNVRNRESEKERRELKRRSDGILREVRRTVVEDWNREPSLGRWDGEERPLLEGIREILVEHLPKVRYPENR